MANEYGHLRGTDSSAPATGAYAITPSDATELTDRPPRALWIGTGGDVVVDTSDEDEDVTFANVPNGTRLDIQVKKVKAATTASDIVAMV